ncbi:MAG TPA: glycosyltransferase family 2 protein, partial [Candidatus Acidoferrales bacterium]|nr:glycosyltransferase family 2 protein [Candidatus Acidoferrales bacterium]
MTTAVALLAGATFGVAVICLVYLWVLALASIPQGSERRSVQPRNRFAVVVPAHDEAGTIGATIRRLRQQEYPQQLCSVIVVADNCVDETASEARGAGAVVLERNDPDRRSKGYALAWALPQIIASQPLPDAIVIFDADTSVD